jgi:hypothetical protein
MFAVYSLNGELDKGGTRFRATDDKPRFNVDPESLHDRNLERHARVLATFLPGLVGADKITFKLHIDTGWVTTQRVVPRLIHTEFS